ncbi:NAD(P)-dependent oxidoreductase [Pelagimonas varians]|uniref:NAD-dependent dihydropyrimidine dehydrogenase subunit PreT n=1 Tax=Pelagimonas varians TaxID=696760 RepID=A0A238KWC3_9RHOB|nr:NAD(P)-dependent oxidoreductase [Pelagimonas varians]PYG28332.1 glutamate synthase (NADPH/NADH) small chain [Pelagimonas varians]SMX46502.1 NAD-dependent dihydropyrimidine dehydrogenase subunit PreT [Pelagimonas varians]
MSSKQFEDGITAGRLDAKALDANFSDLHPAYDAHEALVAADRCYFCHDAPCQVACPTSIDIPLFIRQIATGTAESAARTILEDNILGGMCARVCPTETLCEEVCVRETAEGKPVEIGRLQRFATDTLMASGTHPFSRAASTGKKVAVVGAGPAGLACAHRLAMHGHDAVIFEARAKGGGLNEFGIAAYKSTNDFAQAEVDWLLKIGGIEIRYSSGLGDGISLDSLQADFDAVFLGMGLGGVNALRLDGEDKDGVMPATSFIEELRQATDLTGMSIGRRVVVVGGGMTAIDAGAQAKLLGAQDVTIVYRRGQEAMAASEFEQDLAAQKGVRIIHNATPIGIEGNGSLTGVRFAYTETQNGKLVTLEDGFTLPADQLFTAIGQSLTGAPDALDTAGGKITVGDTGQTSVAGVWAGGDCASGGDDLTVTAVAEGRDAAMNIHATLMGEA